MRRHPFDPISFTLGALLALVAALGLLSPERLRTLDLGVLAPAALVLVGGLLLAGAALSGRREDRDRTR